MIFGLLPSLMGHVAFLYQQPIDRLLTFFCANKLVTINIFEQEMKGVGAIDFSLINKDDHAESPPRCLA